VRDHALEPWAQRRAFLDAVVMPPSTKQRIPSAKVILLANSKSSNFNGFQSGYPGETINGISDQPCAFGEAARIGITQVYRPTEGTPSDCCYRKALGGPTSRVRQLSLTPMFQYFVAGSGIHAAHFIASSSLNQRGFAEFLVHLDLSYAPFLNPI